MAEIFEKVEFHQGNPKTEKYLGSIHNLSRGWAMMILKGGQSFSLL